MAGFGSVLVSVGAALVTTVVPIWVLLALLNARDRRQAALVELVCAQFPSEWGRSDLAVAARSGLVSRRGSVRVDLGSSSREQAWPAIARLREILPPRVRLVVHGRLDARLERARLTVEALPTSPVRRAA
jgi:hypothetical protein